LGLRFEGYNNGKTSNKKGYGGAQLLCGWTLLIISYLLLYKRAYTGDLCLLRGLRKQKQKKNTEINLVKRFVVYLFESVMDLESLVDLVLVGLKPWLASDWLISLLGSSTSLIRKRSPI